MMAVAPEHALIIFKLRGRFWSQETTIPVVSHSHPLKMRIYMTKPCVQKTSCLMPHNKLINSKM